METTFVDLKEHFSRWKKLRDDLTLFGEDADACLASTLLDYWYNGHSVPSEDENNEMPEDLPETSDLDDSNFNQISNQESSVVKVEPATEADPPYSDDRSKITKELKVLIKEEIDLNDYNYAFVSTESRTGRPVTSLAHRSKKAKRIETRKSTKESYGTEDDNEGGTKSDSISVQDSEQTHKCSHCSQLFIAATVDRMKHEFTQHTNTSDYPLKCSQCTERFIEAIELVKHEKTTHDIKHPKEFYKQLMYECTSCGKMYQTTTNLARHLMTHRKHSEWPFTCMNCKKKFIELGKLVSHKYSGCKGEKSGADDLKCLQCSVVFDKQADLEAHDCPQKSSSTASYDRDECDESEDDSMDGDKHPKQFKRTRVECKICKKVLQNSTSLRRHELTHKDRSEWPHACKLCDKKFIQEAKLRLHEKTHARKQTRICTLCGESFLDYEEFRTHQKQHVENGDIKEGEVNLQCKFCNKTFARERNLAMHLSYHTGKLDHQCDLCGKMFPEQSLLRRHIERHSDVKRYKCDQCDKSFNTTGLLDKHMAIHSGVNPYICQFCGDSFTRRFTLNIHMQIHKDILPLSCGDCGRGFAEQADLDEHVKIHVPGNSHKCPHCAKDFKIKSQLRTHLYSHIPREEWPLACVICGKRFYLERHLDKHTKTHDKVFQWNCQTCGAGFHKRADLCAHTALHGAEMGQYPCKHCDRRFKSVNLLTKHLTVHSDVRCQKCRVCGKSYKWVASLYKHMKKDHPTEPIDKLQESSFSSREELYDLDVSLL